MRMYQVEPDEGGIIQQAGGIETKHPTDTVRLQFLAAV
jgi:hypothetical protein